MRVQDVAKAVGVSGATVSRALNRSGPVTPKLRRQIEEAARKLGYVLNGRSRAVLSRETPVIGAIIPHLENTSFAAAAEAMQERLADSGYGFVLASNGYSRETEFAKVKALVAHGVAGVILVGGEHDTETLNYLYDHSVPFVFTWTITPGMPSVGFDNAEAAARIANHLLDLGHTRFGVIAGLTWDNDRARSRLEGVRAALAARGLPLLDEALIERPYRIVEGQLAARALLSVKRKPTAIYCGNDLLAFGALIECNLQGIRVPQDLSITGFDDLDFASQIRPGLTTLHIPAKEIGERAVDYLLAKIAGTPTPLIVEVPVGLMVRDTTAPPRRE
ncbi:LacI family DNA-binding transcriptional regulator [Variibacter gotjawalensis]|uniref:LacI family DNA-binding transcriptional regulator n=1 Tax=Variibacter gotjawalensis TaxID=1333996 RepID=UPI0013EEC497|nr:substrate-binding domain-containing protein [Variibacter gotjawalensis]NIK47469.1 LacI family transcriptional regulator [Variibacter gotjawalensis]